MAKFVKKGKEPARVPRPEEVKEKRKSHKGLVALLAPEGVTAVSGCVMEGRLCWVPPEMVDQLVNRHGFQHYSG